MPPAKRSYAAKAAQPKPAEQHEEWLQLLRADGPFVTLPILVDALPQGLEQVDPDKRALLRQAWAEVTGSPDTLGEQWQAWVLAELLEYRGAVLREGAAMPDSLGGQAPFADPEGPLRPDGVVMGRGTDGPAPRLLLFRRPWLAELTKSHRGAPAATEEVAERCRRTGVPLALLTNGQFWVLVHARPGDPTTVAVFDADLWSEEPLLLRAFATLLGVRRVASSPTSATGGHGDSLAALFARTADAGAEVTDTLGRQVRDAVEQLVLEVSRLDRESGGRVLDGVAPRDVYRGSLTVMMRLVFLLYAEEQRLLPVDDALYRDSYAVGSLYGSLGIEQDRHGEEIADRRSAAWARLLALFTAVHGGSRHPDLRIPAYGGSLFDPERYRWLGRVQVTDRVVFKILDALLQLRRAKGAERLSYKGLDVEQIGHVYEGLLEYSCRRTVEPWVGIAFGRHTAEVPLADLERWADDGTLAAELKLRTGATPKQIDKARSVRPKLGQATDLDTACGNDDALAARVAPWFGLLRRDLRKVLTVYPTGSVILARVQDRRSTGTHYTPRRLAEEVVEHTLAPLCFSPGPAEGAAVWKAKSADELLKLKVLDPAMGSGAFLVSAARYVAARVVQAWERDGIPEDVASYAGTDNRDELQLAALRLVADRCVHGVDSDEMAVELAKLSLWIVTLAKDRPFSFLDHALRSGDSLVGTIRPEQISLFHLDPGDGRQINTEIARTLELTDGLLSGAAQLRREIEDMPDLYFRTIRDKAEKLSRAEELTDRLRLAADAVVGAALSSEVLSDSEIEDRTGEANQGGNRAVFRAASKGAKEDAYNDRLTAIAPLIERAMDGDGDAHDEARTRIDGWLRGDARAEPIRPLHWPLEFPELMGVGGQAFDAVVGNPPFVGGQRLTGSMGTDYREYLVNRLGGGVRGSADLCAYFLLRNLELAPGRRTGIIATNTIAQGDTREVGLDQVAEKGWSVFRAVKSRPWPGTAAVQVSLVWVGHSGEDEAVVLDDVPVRGITPALDARSRVSGNPHRLVENAGRSFVGSYVLGKGFVLQPEEARALIATDPRNRDVLFPYLNGEDLNSRSDCSPSRWVINFRDWTEDKAREYDQVFSIVEKRVKPERSRNNDRRRRELWWRFTRPASDLYDAIEDLDRVIAIARVSRTAMPVMIPTGIVASEMLIVFSTDDFGHLSALSSVFHHAWATVYSSSLKGDLRYTPSDVYETFPFPGDLRSLIESGRHLDSLRSGILRSRGIGLTAVYNLVHDPLVSESDIDDLRNAHSAIDVAMAAAYGWSDLRLQRDFHASRQGVRWAIAPAERTELIDRLLELNHVRHTGEIARGVNAPRGKRSGTRGPSRQQQSFESNGDALFSMDERLF